MNGMVSAAIRRSGLIAATLCNTMCVYIEQEDDLLSGTSWRSDETPLGPLGISTLILEFNDKGEVEITLEKEIETYGNIQDSLEIINGHYDQDGATAAFSGITMTLNDVNVTFVEAHVSANNTLFLIWRIEDMLYPFTTALHLT